MSKKNFEDDGRTIADMSGLECSPMFIPRTRKKPTTSEPPAVQDTDERPWESTYTPQERRTIIFATLKASILIALAYIVGLGAVILLLIWLWK